MDQLCYGFSKLNVCRAGVSPTWANNFAGAFQTMDQQDCYVVLGLTAGASLAEIKTAYRQLAKQWHPDRFMQNPAQLQQATLKFQQINEAYETLRFQDELEGGAGNNRSNPTRPTTGHAATYTTAVDPESYYQAAQKAANLNRVLEAIENLSQAIRLKPDYLKAYQYRAFLHEQLGHEHRAASDFRKVAELRLVERTADSTVKRPAAATPEPTRDWPCQKTITGLQGYVRSLSLHPQGVLIAAIDSDQILIWHRTHQTWFRRLQQPHYIVHTVRWHPDGDLLASAGADRQIELWNAVDGQGITTLVGHSDRILSLAWSRDGNTLISGSSDCTVRLWNVREKTQKTLKGYSKEVSALAQHPQQDYFASGGLEPLIRLRHSQTGKLIRSLRSNGGTLSLAFAPQGQLLASGGYDAVAYLWDLESRIDPRRLEGHEDRVSAIAFHPQSKMIATGSWDATIRIWQVETGAAIATLTGHKDVVSALSFTPSGDHLISSSWDGTIRIWQVETKSI
ncbi:MAG: DnaJ domain-containing protein [Cyanobacteria bacterium P01_G01_bin.54]